MRWKNTIVKIPVLKLELSKAFAWTSAWYWPWCRLQFVHFLVASTTIFAILNLFQFSCWNLWWLRFDGVVSLIARWTVQDEPRWAEPWSWATNDHYILQLFLINLLHGSNIGGPAQKLVSQDYPFPPARFFHHREPLEEMRMQRLLTSVWQHYCFWAENYFLILFDKFNASSEFILLHDCDLSDGTGQHLSCGKQLNPNHFVAMVKNFLFICLIYVVKQMIACIVHVEAYQG